MSIACDPYNCDEADPETWIPEKKGFCCPKNGKGCPKTTTPMPFDCNDNVANWEGAWAPEKKGYCCVKMNVACDPYNCDEGVSDTWIPEKKGFCCPKNGKGGPTTTPMPFDCNEDVATWE